MKFFSRQTRRSASPKLRTIKLGTERLEERRVLSGFGPEDGAYIVEPWTGVYYDVQIQPGDQKVVAVGSLDNGSPDRRMSIARYDSLGNPDTTYGSGGPSIPPLSGVSAPALGPFTEFGHDIVLQPDGKAVVAGHALTGSQSSFAVARFNTNGSLDGGFDFDGWNSVDARWGDYNPASGVGLQSTGKVVVSGVSFGYGAPNMAEVARFTAGGAVDTGGHGFGTQKKGYTLTTFGMTNSWFRDLAVQPDDKLVAVGAAYNDNGPVSLVVARYSASGTLDKTFNGSGYSLFLPTGISFARGVNVAMQSNGKIVVVGDSTGIDGANDMLVAGGDDWDATDAYAGHPLLMRFSGTASSPLLAAGGTAAASSVTQPLNLAQVQALRTETVARWQATGTDVSGFGRRDVRITDLPDATLGKQSGTASAQGAHHSAPSLADANAVDHALAELAFGPLGDALLTDLASALVG